MNDVNVRRGVTQAKQNESAFSIIVIDAMAAGAIGWKVGEHWGWGVAAFFCSFFLLQAVARNETLTNVVSLIAGAVWALGAYALLHAFQASDQTAIIVAGIAFLVAAGAHIQGMQHLNDISQSKHG